MSMQSEGSSLPAVPPTPALAGSAPVRTGRDLPDAAVHVTVITPHRGWFEWRLRQLWRYRDLIALFVWRDFVSVYKQTILGPAWHVVQPLLTTFVFTIIFSLVARLSTDGMPPFLFYLAGFIPWTYFATCLDSTAKTFVANSALLGKVYFHRLVIPVAIAISSLIAFFVQLAIFLVLLAAYAVAGAPIHVTGWVFTIPLLLVILAGYGLGAGIIVCALTTKYRDLRHLVTFGVQLLMYVSPVIYPLSAVPGRFRPMALLNPLTPVIEGFRLGLLGVGTVTPSQIAVSFGFMLIVVIIGVMLFTRIERSFMDTV